MVQRCRWLVSVLLLLAACASPPAQEQRLSGKTVWGDKALEKVQIFIERSDGGHWSEVAKTLSGYHGSFRMRLAPGTYRLRAQTVVEMDGSPVELGATLGPLEVPGKQQRLDRLVLHLSPLAQTSPD